MAGERRGLLALTAAGAVLVACQVIAFGDTAASAVAPKGAGVGPPRAGQLTGSVAKLPLDARLFSNDPWTLWSRTGREPILLSPRTNDVTAFKRAACGGAYLAWYPASSRGFVAPDRLRDTAALDTVVTTSDGQLYKVGACR